MRDRCPADKGLPMADHKPSGRGLLEVDAVLRGTQMRLCGRWAAQDASAQLVNRWISELEPLLESHKKDASSRDDTRTSESTSVVTANLQRLASQLRLEYERRSSSS